MTPLQSPHVEAVSSTLVIKNNLDQLVKLSEWINRLAGEIGLPTAKAFHLELALTEAVTNIIEYAFEAGAEHEITVKLSHRSDHLAVELIDEGRPFDPTRYKGVELPGTLDEAEVGGLGIHLLRSYTDKIQYKRRNNQNILTLIFGLDPPTRSSQHSV